ncbi:GNAT family N-acetyltransferase [Mycobacterium shigaense]|uniref:GNAT family N-acetyltransferase n=1 Tax=Mycobacterium shigaense TaxID=722731 RepID=UPI000E5750BA
MNTDPASSVPAAGLPIRTERLTIRPLRRSDLDAMHAVYSDPEATRFIPGGVRDRDGTRQRVADLIDHHDCHGASKWAVTLSHNGQLIGDCGLQFLPGRQDLELGFHFARAYWGHGYAAESASACLAWAWTNRTERILAIVDPSHHASQRVLAKLGMQRVGGDHILGRSWVVYEAHRDPAS